MENSPKSSEAKKPEPKKKAKREQPSETEANTEGQQTQAQIVQIPSNGAIQLQQVQGLQPVQVEGLQQVQVLDPTVRLIQERCLAPLTFSSSLKVWCLSIQSFDQIAFDHFGGHFIGQIGLMLT